MSGASIIFSLALLAGIGAHGEADAQGRAGGAGRQGGGAGAPARTARAVAPKDFEGYWVSVVSEDWLERMTVPPKGSYARLPLNAAGRKVADAWDPARDQATGNECRSYGAAAIMRVPGRLHIHWADDNTLQVDTDAGTQTRLFHFGGSAPANQAPQWQGYSVAEWEGIPTRELQARTATTGEDPRGDLKVTTTHMRPGYLRKNGAPYGGHTILVEDFDRFSEPNGDTWLVVTAIVTDPQYLNQPYVTTTHFKKIPERSGWDPTPCRSDQPR
jgi:hypothetical protein